MASSSATSAGAESPKEIDDSPDQPLELFQVDGIVHLSSFEVDETCRVWKQNISDARTHGTRDLGAILHLCGDR